MEVFDIFAKQSVFKDSLECVFNDTLDWHLKMSWGRPLHNSLDRDLGILMVNYALGGYA